ncbi:hypothetical protein [Mangrovibacterium sp.]|uniref:hypothetical protein n=1 Tax=Mangrovibacterium sp. TaxID=1961364 RepID=UPI003564A882
MKNMNVRRGVNDQGVNLAEFTTLFRKVHQLVAMVSRTDKEDKTLYQGLEKCTKMLQFIHPGKDRQIDKLIDFSFHYYMSKKEEATDGNQKSARIVRDLKPLFHKELLSLMYLN